MCGRFTLQTPVPQLVELFEVDHVRVAPPGPRFNVAPTDAVAVVRQRGDGGRELDALRWGLIPRWTRDPSQLPMLINARAETLDSRPAFEEPVRSRRCLVLADGFYEWRTEAGRRQPYLVRMRSGRPFALAGLWDRWSGDPRAVPGGPGGASGDARGPIDDSERSPRDLDAPVESCTIITTDANDLLRPVHDRMPVILAPEDVSHWLDPEVRLYAELAPLLEPFPSDAVELVPVSPRVNHIRNDDAGCVEPLGPPISTPSELTARIAERPTEVPEPPPEQLDLL